MPLPNSKKDHTRFTAYDRRNIHIGTQLSRCKSARDRRRSSTKKSRKKAGQEGVAADRRKHAYGRAANVRIDGATAQISAKQIAQKAYEAHKMMAQ